MKVLVLSCKTGGGHDAAGKAVVEQFTAMGDEAVLFDYLTLAGQKVSDRVGGSYVGLVKRVPALFGVLYHIGAFVSRIMHKSPVYYMNGLMAPYLKEYLEENDFDAIVMPHLFPAETITYMKRKGIRLPLTVAVATDYTCIPFWDETECDYYVIPSEILRKSFRRGNIKNEQILSFGIPVSPRITGRRNEGKDNTYLVVGGSMGAGQLVSLVGFLGKLKRPQDRIIAICGTNRKVRSKMERKFKDRTDITIIGHTNNMPDFLEKCNVIFTKPGGLTSTEAAVAGIPIVHTSPIPGCETVNRRFFVKRGMSVTGTETLLQVMSGIRLMEDEDARIQMQKQQKKYIPKDAAAKICNFVRNEV